MESLKVLRIYTHSVAFSANKQTCFSTLSPVLPYPVCIAGGHQTVTNQLVVSYDDSFGCFNPRVREHAVMLGMLLPDDENFLWIAEESLLAPLPDGELLHNVNS